MPARWRSRTFISGFTGSAGVAVITKNKALVWADGRYYIQAEKEISGSYFELMKWGSEGVPSPYEWVGKNVKDGMTIGFDGEVISLSTKREIDKHINASDIKFATLEDLVDIVWYDRPDFPMDKVWVHNMPFAANTVDNKLNRLREKMREESSDYVVVPTLDDIAWLFNIRGFDIDYCPVVMSYAIIGLESATLFVKDEKSSDDLQNHLSKYGVDVMDYAQIEEYIKGIADGKMISFDPKTLSYKISNSFKETHALMEKSNPVEYIKSMKTEEEIANLKACQVRDGVAMVKFLMWLDKNIPNGNIDELSAENRLRDFRAEVEHFVFESFHTISAYGQNAAMMHYAASEVSNAKVEPKGLFLVDSGGNYLDGTTDITRTIAAGELTEQMMVDYTLTLISHIRLAKLRFLYGATGSKIDMIARQPMWENAMDYKSGTGHGVGYFLNVHEGPQNIGMSRSNVILESGMVVTDEPGVYREGEHGIRIENTLVVRDDITNEFGRFLKFEIISYCPIDLRPVKVQMLSDDEKAIVRRARNQKPNSVPKYATLVDYTHATALEALLGHYMIEDNIKRIEEIMQLVIEVINNSDIR